MVSFRKKFLIVSFASVALLPLFARAQTGDYLFISGEYASSTFTHVMVDERTLDAADAHLYQKGTYEARLYTGDKTIGRNFFEIPENEKMEVISIVTQSAAASSSNSYGTFTAASQVIQVTVPLISSVQSEKSGIQILKNGQILFDKKLSELAFNVASANTNHVLVKEPGPPVAEPPVQQPATSSGAGTSWIWIILVMLCAGIVFMLHKKGKFRPIYQKILKLIGKTE